MEYILVIFMWRDYNPNTQSLKPITFSSQTACEKARTEVLAQIAGAKWYNANAICVKK